MATEGLGPIKEGLESKLSAFAVCVPLHCMRYTCSTTLVVWESFGNPSSAHQVTRIMILIPVSVTNAGGGALCAWCWDRLKMGYIHSSAWDGGRPECVYTWMNFQNLITASYGWWSRCFHEMVFKSLIWMGSVRLNKQNKKGEGSAAALIIHKQVPMWMHCNKYQKYTSICVYIEYNMECKTLNLIKPCLWGVLTRKWVWFCRKQVAALEHVWVHCGSSAGAPGLCVLCCVPAVCLSTPCCTAVWISTFKQSCF